MKTREIWCYHHREFITKASTLKEAAAVGDTSSTTVRMILLGRCDCTRDGWVFSYDELTPEEIGHMPDRNEEKQHLKRIGKSCKKEVENQEYDCDCRTGSVIYVPRSKQETKALLRKMIFLKMRDRWMLIPRHLATLEKQAFRELIDAL